MGMLRISVLAVVVLLSATAIFIGIVLLLTSLKLGSITISYTVGAEAITETISRADDNARFWRLMTLLGLAPLVLGAASLWISLKAIRTPPSS